MKKHEVLVRTVFFPEDAAGWFAMNVSKLIFF